jgi:hypothetical protein
MHKLIPIISFVLLIKSFVFGQSGNNEIPRAASPVTNSVNNASNSQEVEIMIYSDSSIDYETKKNKNEIQKGKIANSESKKSLKTKAITDKEELLTDGLDNKIMGANMEVFQTALFKFNTLNFLTSTKTNQKTPSIYEKEALKQEADFLLTEDPNSLLSNLAVYQANRHDVNYASNLFKCVAIDSNDKHVNSQLSLYYIQTDSLIEFNALANNQLKPTYLNPSVLVYYTDLINSVPVESTLLLHGYSDLIPTQYLLNNSSKKINLISAELLQSNLYRENLKLKGYSLPSGDFIDTAYISKFCELNYSKEIYLSMTFPKDYFTGIQSHLYVSGLALKYGKLQTNQSFYNSSLYEGFFSNSNLRHPKLDASDALTSNYYPSLLESKKYYETNGFIQKAEEITREINGIQLRSEKRMPVPLSNSRK